MRLGTGVPPTCPFLPCQATETFHITIRPAADALPVVQSLGMRVQEGVRKTITESELKAVAAGTEVSALPGLRLPERRPGASGHFATVRPEG